jgi:phage baseplate assembly protein W
MTILNVTNRKYSDLNFNFTEHPKTADVTKKTNEEAVKQSVRNLVLTSYYERPFHPEIGSPVYSLLFDNIDVNTRNFLKTSIIQLIENYEPRVEVIDVLVDVDPSNNALSIDILFKIINTTNPITINVLVDRVR